MNEIVKILRKGKILSSFFLLFIYSCSNSTQKVELNNCMTDVNFYFFNGIYPDMENKKAINILGKPDEIVKIDDGDEEGDDLYYYYSEGRVLLHASDYSHTIGLIEFRPKAKLYLKDVLQSNINVTKKQIEFYCDGDRKFVIYINDTDNSIKEIYWWNN